MGVVFAGARGRDFETEVAKLLREAGFQVTVDAGVARPRQTDLFARSDSFQLLVEAKNRKKKVDVGDVDAIRARLNRTAADIIGVIFSTSGLTDGAIKAIEEDRTRELLAFAKDEIEDLRRGNKNLLTLLERKRTEIRVHGKAWFSKVAELEFSDVELPTHHSEFQLRGKNSTYFESGSGLTEAFYSLDVPDSGWGLFGGEGARLSMRPALHSLDDLQNLVGYIHRNFGLSSNGWFSIHQSENSWYGIGIDSFLHATIDWRRRYEQARSQRFHHSEQLIYFDKFRDGWIELSLQQRVGLGERPQGLIHNSYLVIQLPGIPVDAAPYLKLCRYVGNDFASFEHIAERLTSRIRLKSPIKLDVCGTIISRKAYASDDLARGVVVGLVTRNPFHGRKSLPVISFGSERVSLQELAKTELLVCSLRDWHDEGDKVDCYRLQGIEVTTGGAMRVLRPFGTWNRMLKRARGVRPKART